MLAKVYKMEAIRSKTEVKTNRFVSILDSEKFDILFEKALQAMFSVIVIVGIPYFLYIIAKGLF